MNSISVTGGARIGYVTVSRPFATLTISESQMEINATFIGKLVFKPSDIISIEIYDKRVIKINHTVKKYNSNVTFGAIQNPAQLIRKMNEIGFYKLNNEELSLLDEQEKKKKKNHSFDKINISKNPSLIALIILWNFLFLIDLTPFFKNIAKFLPFGSGIITALGLAFICANLCRYSKYFRELLIQREELKIGDKTALNLVISVTGILIIVLGTIIQMQK